ncbi:MAG: hypothetical protein ACRDNZ_00930 [Streptosporangiaceae bacterium]
MNHWTVIIEGCLSEPLTTDAQAALTADLGVILTDTATGRIHVTMAMEAATVVSAVTTAHEKVTGALDSAGASARITETRVVTTSGFEAEVMRPPGQDLLGVTEAASILASPGSAPPRSPPPATTSRRPSHACTWDRCTRAAASRCSPPGGRARTGRPRKTAS